MTTSALADHAALPSSEERLLSEPSGPVRKLPEALKNLSLTLREASDLCTQSRDLREYSDDLRIHNQSINLVADALSSKVKQMRAALAKIGSRASRKRPVPFVGTKYSIHDHVK